MNSRIETKAAFTVDDAGEITATAWVFSKPDRVGDVILPSAFSSVKTPLPILFAHDQKQPIGVWDSVSVMGDKLVTKGRLLIDGVEKAREVYAMIKAGAISGVSIGFKTKASTPRKGGGRNISNLDLVEISTVSVPAHPDARISSIKSATHPKGRTMENDNIDDNEVKTVDVTEIEEKFTSLETKLASFDSLGSRLDKIEARLSRPGAPAIITKKEDAADIERKAFVDYLRTGQIEQKALSVASNGGVLIPQVLLNEIQKNLVEISPIRSIARVTSIGVPKVSLPKRSAGSQGAWVSETANRSETSSTYAAPQDIEAYEYAGYVEASLQVLEDSMFDLQSEIARDIAEDLAKAEGAAFVNSDGNGKPTGFLNSPAVGSIVNATPTGGAMPTADDFITAFYSLPSAYARNAVWVLNRSIMGAIRKMKTTSGDYIWAASPGSNSLAFANAGTLLGAPVVEVPDAPSLAASTVVATVGDFKEAYRIVDRVGLDILRDDFTARANGKVRWHFRRRVGGEVVNANALRFLKTTAGA